MLGRSFLVVFVVGIARIICVHIYFNILGGELRLLHPVSQEKIAVFARDRVTEKIMSIRILIVVLGAAAIGYIVFWSSSGSTQQISAYPNARGKSQPILVKDETTQPKITSITNQIPEVAKVPVPPDVAAAKAAAVAAKHTQRVKAGSIVFSDFFRENAMSEEQRQLFLTLYADRMEVGEKLLQTIANRGEKIDPMTVQVVADQTEEEMLAKMRANFGDDTVKAFQRYQEERPIRIVVDSAASALSRADAPLTSDQIAQLTSIIVASSRDTTGKVDLKALNFDTIMINMPPSLSQKQLEIIKEALNNAAQTRRIQDQKDAKAKSAGGV